MKCETPKTRLSHLCHLYPGLRPLSPLGRQESQGTQSSHPRETEHVAKANFLSFPFRHVEGSFPCALGESPRAREPCSAAPARALGRAVGHVLLASGLGSAAPREPTARARAQRGAQPRHRTQSATWGSAVSHHSRSPAHGDVVHGKHRPRSGPRAGEVSCRRLLPPRAPPGSGRADALAIRPTTRVH